MKKYPIPTHLKNILKIDASLSDMNNIAGKILCNCGCEKFKIMQNEDIEYDSFRLLIRYRKRLTI